MADEEQGVNRQTPADAHRKTEDAPTPRHPQGARGLFRRTWGTGQGDESTWWQRWVPVSASVGAAPARDRPRDSLGGNLHGWPQSCPEHVINWARNNEPRPERDSPISRFLSKEQILE